MTNGTEARRIRVDYLARVEGEGALDVRIVGDQVSDVRLRIFEPPRFFEAFLRGRREGEALDFTSRICGICPIAYLMSSSHAIESAYGVRVGRPIRELRRLAYCGEWIGSHALHVYMLHAPDFLGFEDAIGMARKFPKDVQRGLQLKKIGNEIISLLGGREIHPINFRVGGFYRLPSASELAPLEERLEWARDAAMETLRWVSGFEFPDFESDYELVSLFHETEYPMNEGRLVSSLGLNIDAKELESRIEEFQVPGSTALYSRLRERGAYLTGPQARVHLCFEKLSPIAREAARSVGFQPADCRNPFKSILARSLEILYAADEALRVIRDLREIAPEPGAAAVPHEPRAGVGCACTEAPRGTLYHRYSIGAKGLIEDARIIPPTSQNQSAIERDLRRLVESSLRLEDAELARLSERMIRNFDPCISCATHFLKLKVDRDGA